jgi:acetolactate synthase small subunit
MLEEIIVTVDDRPGVLAEVGELLGASNLNIETFCATTVDGRGLIPRVVFSGL